MDALTDGRLRVRYDDRNDDGRFDWTAKYAIATVLWPSDDPPWSAIPAKGLALLHAKSTRWIAPPLPTSSFPGASQANVDQAASALHGVGTAGLGADIGGATYLVVTQWRRIARLRHIGAGFIDVGAAIMAVTRVSGHQIERQPLN